LNEDKKVLKRLPSVDAVLARDDIQSLVDEYSRVVVREGVRRALQARREFLLAGGAPGEGLKEEINVKQVEKAITEWMTMPLRQVLNATGVILHTNLGRAPLAKEVVQVVTKIAEGYSNLELDLKSGERGSRMSHLKEIILERCGGEDALVVNNNAAAVYLALRTLAHKLEVIVSRGELVEIGGSFRIPDVMAASGAKMIEVGTTNKTRIDDYRRAIGPDTGLILKVHRSNFAVVGFTEEASIGQLANLAQDNGIPLVMDLGAGWFLDSGLPDDIGTQYSVENVVSQGADLICFSGDKLLGGPQAGIIIGKKRYVQALAKDPMARALRVGKLTIAALWATIALYRGDLPGAKRVPVVEMMLADPKELKVRAERLEKYIQTEKASVATDIISTKGQVGGGSMPLLELAGYGVALKPANMSVSTLAENLRTFKPEVLARIHQDQVVLDVRTIVGDEQLKILAKAVKNAARQG
jgi:L-seryl-tRNA(Ser) seleniumtransferase